MRIAGGQTEQGIVIGNTYDKYGSQNPIVKFLVKRFDSALSALVEKTKPETIHELGCGEGYWVCKWRRLGIEARGTDFSNQVIEIARVNAEQFGIPPSTFQVRSIYDIEPGRDSADLIVCCEVLEHLENPIGALQALHNVVTQHLIISVPREPIWRILNLARGKYVSDLGNTPGHLQHWSTRNFVALVKDYFNVLEIQQPLPWTMLLCQAKTD